MKQGMLMEYQLVEYKGLVVLGYRAPLGVEQLYGQKHLQVVITSASGSVAAQEDQQLQGDV